MKVLFCIFICLICIESKAQTRFFISAGTNTNTEFTAGPSTTLGLTNNSISLGSYNVDGSVGRYLCLDLTAERRLYGPYYWRTGIMLNQTGYQYQYNTLTSTFTSDLKNTYLSLPLLVRINFYNANSFYLDFGLIENFLVTADLKESYNQVTAHQDISRHLSFLSTSLYFEMMIAIDRFGIGMFSQSKAFGSSSDFSEDWNISRNKSYFLLYHSHFSFKNAGLKLTYRLY